MANGAEYLFMCLFAFCISPLNSIILAAHSLFSVQHTVLALVHNNFMLLKISRTKTCAQTYVKVGLLILREAVTPCPLVLEGLHGQC